MKRLITLTLGATFLSCSLFAAEMGDMSNKTDMGMNDMSKEKTMEAMPKKDMNMKKDMGMKHNMKKDMNMKDDMGMGDKKHSEKM